MDNLSEFCISFMTKDYSTPEIRTIPGIFVVSSIIGGYWVDKKKPDRFEIIGSIVVLISVTVMFYFPR